MCNLRDNHINNFRSEGRLEGSYEDFCGFWKTLYKIVFIYPRAIPEIL